MTAKDISTKKMCYDEHQINFISLYHQLSKMPSLRKHLITGLIVRSCLCQFMVKL